MQNLMCTSWNMGVNGIYINDLLIISENPKYLIDFEAVLQE